MDATILFVVILPIVRVTPPPPVLVTVGVGAALIVGEIGVVIDICEFVVA